MCIQHCRKLAWFDVILQFACHRQHTQNQCCPCSVQMTSPPQTNELPSLMMYVTYQRERAHQAVVKAHITNIKYVCAFLVVACIAQLIAVCALTFATTCCQNAQFAPPQHVQSCIGSPHKYFGSRHYRAQNIANHSSRQFRIASRLQFTM